MLPWVAGIVPSHALHVQEDDYGRARVHTQWGNDEELIEEAVQMCPVDCIAYVSPSLCRPASQARLPSLVLPPCQQEIVSLAPVMHAWKSCSGLRAAQAAYDMTPCTGQKERTGSLRACDEVLPEGRCSCDG